jgi:hypothetical protein
LEQRVGRHSPRLQSGHRPVRTSYKRMYPYSHASEASRSTSAAVHFTVTFNSFSTPSSPCRSFRPKVRPSSTLQSSLRHSPHNLCACPREPMFLADVRRYNGIAQQCHQACFGTRQVNSNVYRIVRPGEIWNSRHKRRKQKRLTDSPTINSKSTRPHSSEPLACGVMN